MNTSQRQNILRRLLDSPMCGTTRDWQLGQRLSARVLELRDAGFWITTEPCSNEAHNHRTRQIEYRLLAYGEALDGCAYCGPGTSQSVTHVDGAGTHVKCDLCGRKDWRP